MSHPKCEGFSGLAGPEAPALRPSRGCHDGDPFGAGRDAVRQANVPPPLALVNPQHDARVTGRVIGGRIEQQKSRSQLGDRNGMPIQNQFDPDICGMTAMTA